MGLRMVSLGISDCQSDACSPVGTPPVQPTIVAEERPSPEFTVGLIHTRDARSHSRFEAALVVPKAARGAYSRGNAGAAKAAPRGHLRTVRPTYPQDAWRLAMGDADWARQDDFLAGFFNRGRAEEEEEEEQEED